jgi:hypothetical protein
MHYSSIYNSPKYLELESIREQAIHKNFSLINGENYFDINYLQRENPTDIVSPYGYAGYTSNGDTVWLENAITEFKEYLLKEGVITAFIRNKLSNTQLSDSSECVYIDLNDEINYQS